jgi:hypothetical protein
MSPSLALLITCVHMLSSQCLSPSSTRARLRFCKKSLSLVCVGMLTYNRGATVRRVSSQRCYTLECYTLECSSVLPKLLRVVIRFHRNEKNEEILNRHVQVLATVALSVTVTVRAFHPSTRLFGHKSNIAKNGALLSSRTCVSRAHCVVGLQVRLR